MRPTSTTFPSAFAVALACFLLLPGAAALANCSHCSISRDRNDVCYCPDAASSSCTCSAGGGSGSSTGGNGGGLARIFGGERSNYHVTPDSMPSLLGRFFSRHHRTRWAPPPGAFALRHATRLLARENFSRAEEAFSEALRLGESSAAAHNGLAWAQLRQGKRPEAIATLREAVRRGEDDSQSRQLLAYACSLDGADAFARGDFLAARKAYRDALDAYSLDTDARRELPRVTAYLDAVAQRDVRPPVDLHMVDFGGPAIRPGIAGKGAANVAADGDPAASEGVIVSLPSSAPYPSIDPTFEKERAALDAKVDAAKAWEAKLAVQAPSPARDLELAKARIARSNAESGRRFVDVASTLGGTDSSGDAFGTRKASPHMNLSDPSSGESDSVRKGLGFDTPGRVEGTSTIPANPAGREVPDDPAKVLGERDPDVLELKGYEAKERDSRTAADLAKRKYDEEKRRDPASANLTTLQYNAKSAEDKHDAIVNMVKVQTDKVKKRVSFKKIETSGSAPAGAAPPTTGPGK